ncbi:heavy metal translocating P-type ATPase [Butyricicoccus sp. AF22-28AC]|jgi:heavy metal translocating P-type ATPase|nr:MULTISPECIES: heavy metal translocating P-type ATPase [unclassified Butyricicoccus]RGM80499.1 heavy metal translocating P-type ATPase [Butyricicoccus sp. OM06-6AC]RHQ71254.1 heavy metal translocating P-type ATPase [Butyricicoccus sp. AF24-19AC]RHQ84563.1 heavy metal translocating P-type ATPase [Butyricicoccus sp. AF22-28AC]RHR86392.1 heavy metal translocating P-type ATPase [Butyricicoccus sp. AF15-40]
MKAIIEHESRGRLRVRMKQYRMTLEQADLLEAYLQNQPGVLSATVHERTCCAVIRYIGDRENIIRAIAQFNYTAPSVTALTPTHSGRALNREYQEKLVGKVITKFACTLFLPAPLQIARTIWLSLPFLGRGLKRLIHRELKVELLDALSIGVSMVRRDFSTAGSVMFLLDIGELLEEWTHKKSVDDLARCMSLNVKRVWLKTDDAEVLVPLSNIAVGDHILVRMGSVIPLDGEVVEGEVMVNQASLTGESMPVAKRPGTQVYAGTVIEEGDCVIEVTQSSGESRYDKIVSMIEQSEQLKSAAESHAANLADKLVPYTLIGSALSYALTRNVTRALSVLMVDFSCALKLAMPLAVLSAMREASMYHITVKGGKFLEAVAQADTIVFDKTGTLTHACPVVARVIPFGGHSADDMLRVAACLEEHFPHSMANAVVRAARERDLAHEEMHSQVEYIVAHGISSMVENKKVVIGSAHFIFEDEKCTVPVGEQEKYDALPVEFSHLYLAIGGELAAVICIADPLRPEACDVMKALRALGIQRTVMLTGDSERTAAAIAAEVGVDDYRAEVLPEDKANFVEQERAAGHTVIMLGDGINDSPALSAANVGVAISDGAAIAREIADITIAAENLFELVALRRIAQGLMSRINSNYRFVIGFNGSLIGLGVAGVLAPATSAMMHNLSTLGISLRSMTNLIDSSETTRLLESR